MDDVETLIKNADRNFEKEKYIDALRDYLAAIEKVQDDDLKAEIAYKVSQIYHYLQKDSDENSMKFAEIALKIHEEKGEMDLQVLDLINIGTILIDSGKKEDGMRKLDEAIEKAKETNDDELIMISLTSKAGIISDSDPDEAFKIYQDVAEKSEKIEDWEDYFDALSGLINITRKKDEGKAFQMAMDAIDKLEKISATIKSKKERKEFIESFSYLYDTASDIAMALDNVEDAIEIAKRLQNQA
ncbi:TVG0794454 [Thermoplasma volcanium GSS1]|uniref:TVG0794454 protein n=1 Tax=Thermoplasma volcanium (strain ATCC 51530 / DSM 4299 / JCM 9571 / NBRC 15438 / GSS1) TaxID=273116 RepID=Q97AL7_THEVO|nr:hypothetical protein [Thermoplasma volcanium]BAB59935.1 TVG0794454 [Thermoplasma volcanium GSS1]